MDTLPVYIPHPHICHMAQYQCCKKYQDCSLYAKCSGITKQTVCKRDCPNCSYGGCSLSAENRRNTPVYVAGIIQENRIELNLETRYLVEQLAHKKEHKKRYYHYNVLFGDTRQKNRKRNLAYYYTNREIILAKCREMRQRNSTAVLKMPSEKYMPTCGLNCEECTETDCLLPDDWREKALNRERNKRYYDAHHEMLLEKQKIVRATPQHKERAKAYNRQYQAEHRERVNEKSRRWRKAHPERFREVQKAYREAHRDEINERRRRKRHGL